MQLQNISDIIRARRSVFPKMYNDTPIPVETIHEILENANWAPTHKMTEPWRFKVIRGKALERLSEFLGNYYKKASGEKYSEMKFNKTIKKPLQSDTVILICMQRDSEESVPEWEEMAAVACAVQNMWLTCTTLGIGCYWSSSKAISEMNTFIPLSEGETCVGLFFMGNYDSVELPARRIPVSEKVEWISE